MSFVRPEVTAALQRWREALLGLALAVLGAWWALGFRGLLPYVGFFLVGVGGLLILVGLQRARFRIPGKGPGIVRVIEDQVTYFGPLTGGTIALSDLTRLSIDTSGKPAHWVLAQDEQPDLHIPVTADGAEALFDAFARLPGLRTEQMLTQMKSHGGTPNVIWEKSRKPATDRLLR
jgi:hypothetical protein